MTTKIGTGDVSIASICSGWKVEILVLPCILGTEFSILAIMSANRSNEKLELGRNSGRTM